MDTSKLDEPISKLAQIVTSLGEVALSLRLVQESLPDDEPIGEIRKRTGLFAEEVQDVLSRVEAERRVLEREKKVLDEKPAPAPSPPKHHSD